MWTHVDRGSGGQKRDFFVDVINGWPLSDGIFEKNMKYFMYQKMILCHFRRVCYV